MLLALGHLKPSARRSIRRRAEARLRVRVPATARLGLIGKRTSSGYRRCECGISGICRGAVSVVYRLVTIPRDPYARADCEQLAIIGLLPRGTLRENPGDRSVWVGADTPVHLFLAG